MASKTALNSAATMQNHFKYIIHALHCLEFKEQMQCILQILYQSQNKKIRKEKGLQKHELIQSKLPRTLIFACFRRTFLQRNHLFSLSSPEKCAHFLDEILGSREFGPSSSPHTDPIFVYLSGHHYQKHNWSKLPRMLIFACFRQSFFSTELSSLSHFS